LRLTVGGDERPGIWSAQLSGFGQDGSVKILPDFFERMPRG
jgi:hypothetical protein